VTHGGRTPIITCWRCNARELNETNRLHRQGWEQVRWGRGWVFRCGDCTAKAEGRGEKSRVGASAPIRTGSELDHLAERREARKDDREARG
jgi:hypothetical protein